MSLSEDLKNSIAEFPMDEDTERLLEECITRRQELISSDALDECIDLIKQKWPTMNAPQFEFLKAVSAYHRTTKERSGSKEAWSVLGARFEAIILTSPMTRFYVANYMFLCFRNSQSPALRKRLESIFKQAADISFQLTSAERNEAMGHLHYNAARWLCSEGKTSDALQHWQSAARHRLGFYGELKYTGASDARLLAAAQQIAKMRSDFVTFFPETAILESGVEEKVYDELLAEFGEKLHAFSAVK